MTREESLEFLRRGFSEVGVRVGEDELREVVDRLDGVIGWLTYYGYSRSVGGRDLESIIGDAVSLARQELDNFLSLRVSRRYRVVLRLLASGGVREWGGLLKRGGLEDYEGSPISDRVLHDVLTTLKRYSIIDENLEFTDPIVREAARGL